MKTRWSRVSKICFLFDFKGMSVLQISFKMKAATAEYVLFKNWEMTLWWLYWPTIQPRFWLRAQKCAGRKGSKTDHYITYLTGNCRDESKGKSSFKAGFSRLQANILPRKGCWNILKLSQMCSVMDLMFNCSLGKREKVTLRGISFYSSTCFR